MTSRVLEVCSSPKLDRAKTTNVILSQRVSFLRFERFAALIRGQRARAATLHLLSNDGQARRNFTLEGVIEMLTFGLIIAADLR